MPIRLFARAPLNVRAVGIGYRVRGKIIGHIKPESEQPARLGAGRDIAQVRRARRENVEVEIFADFRADNPLCVAVGKDEAEFVFYLLVPAHRPVGVDNAVVEFLGVFGERNRPDDPQVHGEAVERIARRQMRAEARVKPARVGSVPSRGVGVFDVGGHIHTLPD